MSDIRYKFDEIVKDLDRNMLKIIYATADNLLDMIQVISVSRYMSNNSGNMPEESILTRRTGRLTRDILGWSVRRIKGSAEYTAEGAIRNPYAGIHEFGGTQIPTDEQRQRMVGYFFYRYRLSHYSDEKWLALALHLQKHGSFKFPARPYLLPAIQNVDVAGTLMKQIANYLQDKNVEVIIGI